MNARVETSSGSMWTNCDEVQHAVHVPQGTSESASPRSAACIPSSHCPNSPAGHGHAETRIHGSLSSTMSDSSASSGVTLASTC